MDPLDHLSLQDLTNFTHFGQLPPNHSRPWTYRCWDYLSQVQALNDCCWWLHFPREAPQIRQCFAQLVECRESPQDNYVKGLLNLLLQGFRRRQWSRSRLLVSSHRHLSLRFLCSYTYLWTDACRRNQHGFTEQLYLMDNCCLHGSFLCEQWICVPALFLQLGQGTHSLRYHFLFL